MQLLRAVIERIRGLRWSGLLLAWIVLAAIAALEAEGQVPRQTPLLAPESLVGSTSFDLYCASCHGRGAKGDGRVAVALRTRPADLTTLSQRNGGTFPRDRVLEYIEGSRRQASAHGSGDMPIWGPTLRALETSDARVKVRLQNLVAFIESIQIAGGQAAGATRPVAALDGPTLFRTYCASCHGTDARGTGTMAGQLRRMPPDLTTYTARNGGTFPAERLRQIIEGRGVAAHGDRTMAVWGDVFARAPGVTTAEEVQRRIGALVTYLESIQRRGA